MKKEILVFIFDGYADWECAYICSELNKLEDKYVVKTIGVDREPKKSMGGFTVIPDYSIDECPSDFEMILLIGGEAWEQKKNNSIKAVVDYAIKKNILVAAICGATIFLGEEGYLDEVKHTSNTLDYLKAYAPSYRGTKNYIERQAVNDRNIITANGTATLELAREIMIYLDAKPKKNINEWYEFNKKGFLLE